MMILSARRCSTSVALTEAPESSGVPADTVAPSPTISTSPSSIVAPGSPASLSTAITSSLATLYCLPPVRITANMIETDIGWRAGRGNSGPGAKNDRTAARAPGGAHYSKAPCAVNDLWLADGAKPMGRDFDRSVGFALALSTPGGIAIAALFAFGFLDRTVAIVAGAAILASATLMAVASAFALAGARAAIDRLSPDAAPHEPAALRNPVLLAAADAVLRGEPVQSVEFALSGRIERVLCAHFAWVGELGLDGAAAILTLHDVTALKRSEQMRADFIANAGHELKTPLAALIGFIETLLGPAREDVAARERFLGIMREQAQRMARLVDDLLSLSRIELN